MARKPKPIRTKAKIEHASGLVGPFTFAEVLANLARLARSWEAAFVDSIEHHAESLAAFESGQLKLPGADTADGPPVYALSPETMESIRASWETQARALEGLSTAAEGLNPDEDEPLTRRGGVGLPAEWRAH